MGDTSRRRNARRSGDEWRTCGEDRRGRGQLRIQGIGRIALPTEELWISALEEEGIRIEITRFVVNTFFSFEATPLIGNSVGNMSDTRM